MSQSLVSVLESGKFAVIKTDTVLGIVAKARDKKAVTRLYGIRRESPKKPFIILISKKSDLLSFGVKIDSLKKKFLDAVWPGRVSVIFSCRSKKFAYLHRGANSLAFRLPKSAWIRNLLNSVGPLVAPSANPEGLEVARNKKEAISYFGSDVDFYQSVSGKSPASPSTVVSFLKKKPVIIRRGADIDCVESVIKLI